MRTTDYRDYPTPALVREVVQQIKKEAWANRTEKHLCTRLHLAAVHLNEYAELLDALYLNSLHDHNLDRGPLDTD
jgi:hypothetical protein